MRTNLAGSVMPNTPSSAFYFSSAAMPWHTGQQQQQRASDSKRTHGLSGRRRRRLDRPAVGGTGTATAATRWEQNGATSVLFSPQSAARCWSHFKTFDEPWKGSMGCYSVFCSTYNHRNGKVPATSASACKFFIVILMRRGYGRTGVCCRDKGARELRMVELSRKGL